MKKVHIKIRFTDPILGMSPSNPEIYEDYILSKSPNRDAYDGSDELDAIDGMDEEKSTITVFPRADGGLPCFFDYQIRGFFKDSCKLLAHVKGVDETGKRSKKKAATLSGALVAYQKVIDGNIFVSPRKIVIHSDKDITLCQRPLRAMTAKGERISLACSEEIAAGAWAEFDVTLYNDEDLDVLAEWMAYGRDHGMGQWRNSGRGRFEVEEFTVYEHSAKFIPYFQIERRDK